ncbi:alpha/beta hydrolase [Alicyclobacillus tolerans]|uniref:Carboxylesterase n=2 Tax=Alicyclobacillus tolerans TaxID=90970 RepID=A0ABT9LUU0_9BACL|nr:MULTISPECIES: alpha/beta fold hydrolase [Alicyclobacillus]MDP9728019.1 carboxylesterase [Alicyclobacillus tengchongensis]SHJ91815.1 carboxylesterase [Alicyclobacillus montanus]
MKFQEHHPLMQGAEPFFLHGDSIGVLLQHGFTGTTHSMRYVGEQLAKSGFTVHAPRLAGHGTHPEDMERSTYQDWLDSASQGYEKLARVCDTIFVIGLSMGGTLVANLAHRYPETSGMVLINAVIRNDALKPMLEMSEPRFLPAIGSDIRAEGVQELAYDCTPLRSLRELSHLIDQTRPILADIQCPALILASNEDHVVGAENAEDWMQMLGSPEKQRIALAHSYHVATLDHDKDQIADLCIQFIRTYAPE